MSSIIGMKFGMLYVIKERYDKNKKQYYIYCKCDCGNEKWINKGSVKQGRQISCGCLRIKDWSGQRLGKLTVTNEYKKEDGIYHWKCVCDCGNEKWISSRNLRKSRHCGCDRMKNILEHQKMAFQSYNDKYIKENTNIAIISREKPMRHNTSGITGVRWDKSRKKWIAEITFKNKLHRLGRFEKKEDAIKARKDAEEKFHKSFLKDKGLI